MLEELANLSIVVAVAAYFYKRSQDRKTEVIGQISFFRKDVIPAHQEFVRMVRESIGENYSFQRISLTVPTVKHVQENFPAESQEQIRVIQDAKTHQIESDILNLLTEFSLRVINFGTKNHHALNSVKAPFVELVEQHAITLVMQRDVFTGGETYSSILEVYSEWKDQVDNRTVAERITAIGRQS